MAIQVIDRAVALVELVARRGTASVADLSRETKLPLSTVARIIASLTSHGILERTPDRKYRAGVGLLTLASRVEPMRNLVAMARDAMLELSRSSGEDVGLAVLRGQEAVIIDWIYGPHPLKIIEPFSQSITLNCAFRKVLLAYQSDKWIKSYLQTTRFPQYTPHTKTNPKDIWQEVLAIRRSGLAISRAENILDAGSVAAPIFAPSGELAATVFVTAPLSRFDKPAQARLAKAVLAAGRAVSDGLRTHMVDARPPWSHGALRPSYPLR